MHTSQNVRLLQKDICPSWVDAESDFSCTLTQKALQAITPVAERSEEFWAQTRHTWLQKVGLPAPLEKKLPIHVFRQTQNCSFLYFWTRAQIKPRGSVILVVLCSLAVEFLLATPCHDKEREAVYASSVFHLTTKAGNSTVSRCLFFVPSHVIPRTFHTFCSCIESIIRRHSQVILDRAVFS